MNPEILLSEAKEMQLLLTKHRRYLHTHPELGFDLRQTKEYVKKELISIGYEPVECGKCGLVVLAGSKNSDKTFLIRADMDALPILEQADVKFKSENSGKMHACGHDMHTAMLLGAARLLKRHENELKGTIKLMFQPAEETLEGCKDMVDANVLNNPTVDAALMLHVTLGMPLQTGSAIICDGGISAPAADYFEIKIQGKGCHGAMPELGVDPITIASHIVIALQELHARELAMADDAVLTIGTMQAGDANNIIPDTAVLRGTRSTKHLCEILQIVKDKKLILNIGGSFLVDCSKGELDPMTEGMVKMWGVFAEMERNIISQRVKSGMKNAVAKGKTIGRPATTSDNLPDKFWKYYKQYQDKQINISEFARLLNCSRTSIYKYLRIVEAD